MLGIAAFAVAMVVAPAGSVRGGDGVVARLVYGNEHVELKAKLDDVRIEVEFEVEQNRIGRRWDVTLRRDGRLVFHRIRTTRAPSGSFTIRRPSANTRGPDRIVVRARALATGEVCRGALMI